ncbi:hypothetical protein A2U01_0053714 [Trifolium medium]|uniref:Uncharacterized protein n=1 Tax=Trifolium medium TaxID=97028 RepID=A0A392R9R1_9FABA|nr:hypothetical protein [Trifolium medium]
MSNELKKCPSNPVSIFVYPPSPFSAGRPLVTPQARLHQQPQMAAMELSTPTAIAKLHCSNSPCL